MKKKILIGGAWPSSNNSLHIGHLAALLPGDAIARYYRKTGADVVYVSGSDSHGTPITLRARKEKKSPKEIADYYHQSFLTDFNDLNFSYDHYTTTTTESHKAQVQDYLKTIESNGWFYQKTAQQTWCSHCQQYLADREVTGTCPHCGGEAKGDQCDNCLQTLSESDILDRRCKLCGQPTETRHNEHLYFKLSHYAPLIRELVETHKTTWRKNALSETTKFLDIGLIDRAITRDLEWGIPIPINGFEDKVVYVWFEAVLGYLTTANDFLKTSGRTLTTWLKESPVPTIYMVHGKDNIPFHTVIYPALCQAIDPEIPHPDYIISSEYVNMNFEKMSKSKGNLITARQLLDQFPADTIRYYMLACGPEKRDINFSTDDIIQTHNKQLAGILGNFIHRNLAFIAKKYNHQLHPGCLDPQIQQTTAALYADLTPLIESGEIRTALNKIFAYLTQANKYYDQTQPWIHAKTNPDQFWNITTTCLHIILNTANLLTPFLPETAEAIFKMLNYQPQNLPWQELYLNSADHINEVTILFQRIDIK